MKAKIRKTGEIVNIAEYAKIALDKCDCWGSPIEMKPEEIELVDDETAELELYKQCGYESPLQDYWQEVRTRAAIAAMQGLAANSCLVYNSGEEKIDFIKRAIRYADELVKELKKK